MTRPSGHWPPPGLAAAKHLPHQNPHSRQDREGYTGRDAAGGFRDRLFRSRLAVMREQQVARTPAPVIVLLSPGPGPSGRSLSDDAEGLHHLRGCVVAGCGHLVCTEAPHAQVGPPSPDAAPAAAAPETFTPKEAIAPSIRCRCSTRRRMRGPGRSGAGGSSGSDQKGGLSTAINILVVLTVIGLVPSIMLMCTCFGADPDRAGAAPPAPGTQSNPLR